MGLYYGLLGLLQEFNGPFKGTSSVYSRCNKAPGLRAHTRGHGFNLN